MRYCLGLTVLFLLCAANTALAQKSLFRKADHEFSRMRYKTAIQYYERGLASDSLDVLSVERLALSYKNIRDYKNAEKWFARAIYLSPENSNYYLHYAEALASNKKYESSAYWYGKLAASGDSLAADFSKYYKGNLSAFYTDSAQWKIHFTSLNTTFDEFSPVFFRKGLVFTSNRHYSVRNKFISGWDLNPFIDLYLVPDTTSITRFEILATNEPERITRKPVAQVQDNRTVGDFGVRGLNGSGAYAFNANPTKAKRIKGELRSRFHDGPVSLSGDQRFMMLTRNNFFKGRERLSRDGVNRLKLYSATLENEKWTNLKEFDYNSNEYSTAHPALSSDGNVMYFASDMPGGAGGMDLYYSIKQADKWSRPVNLGSDVNTKGDEVFPFLAASGELYFSSTGLPGLGGMDIFRVAVERFLPVAQPENLGYPVNAAKDDFGLILTPDARSGYFSSNRKGNDDIYSFEFNPAKVSLRGFVVNTDRRSPVQDALVLLRSGTRVDTVRTGSDGRFSFKLKTDTEYQILTSKKGASSATTSLSTKGRTGSSEIPLTLVVADLPGQPAAAAINAARAPEENSRVIKPVNPVSSGMVTATARKAEREHQRKSQSAPSAHPQAKSKESPNAVTRVEPPVKILQENSQSPAPEKVTTPQPDTTRRIPVTVKRVAADMKPVNIPVSVKERGDDPLVCDELRKKYFVDNIYYTLDKSYIRNSELPVLERLIRLMNENPEIKVIVNSHTDARASDAYNQELSNSRSTVVKGFLVSRGIAESRIQTKYYGKTRPLIPCLTAECTEEELQLNRRTEFYIILNGINITLDCPTFNP